MYHSNPKKRDMRFKFENFKLCVFFSLFKRIWVWSLYVMKNILKTYECVSFKSYKEGYEIWIEMNCFGNILYYCTLLHIICEHLHDLYTLNSLSGWKGLKKMIPRFFKFLYNIYSIVYAYILNWMNMTLHKKGLLHFLSKNILF